MLAMLISAPESPARSQFVVSVLRVVAVAVALIPLGLLAVSRTLEPDSDGLGTHQQLGLPPCTTRVVFGIRCPACGMTTSWAHFTRGNFGASVSANFGGFLLAILALAASPIAIYHAWRGKYPSHRVQARILMAILVVLVTAMVDWGVRLLNG